MLVLDFVERRQVEREFAFGEERIGGHVGFLIGWVWRGRWRGVGRATRRYQGDAEKDGNDDAFTEETRSERWSEMMHRSGM